MGTVPVDLLPAAAGEPLFTGLPDRFLAQATHLQSVLRAPEGATVLARSDHDDCHAFRWGEAAGGVQFHPEFGTVHMRGYVRARAEALARDGFDPKRIAADLAAAPHARRVMRRFVRHARRRQALYERRKPRAVAPSPAKAGEGWGGVSWGTARTHGIPPASPSR